MFCRRGLDPPGQTALSLGREITDKRSFLVAPVLPLQSMDLRAATGGIFFPNLTGKLWVLGKEGLILSLFFFV